MERCEVMQEAGREAYRDRKECVKVSNAVIVLISSQKYVEEGMSS